MKLLLVSLLGSVAVVNGFGPLSIVGKCRPVAPEPGFDYRKYFYASNRQWNFYTAANTPDNQRMTGGFLLNTPTADGKLYTEIYVQEQGEDFKHHSNSIVTPLDDATLFTNVIDRGEQLRIVFLLCEVEKFAYYYICKDDSEYEVDSTFIITAQGYQLNQYDLSRINNIHQTQQLRGNTRPLY